MNLTGLRYLRAALVAALFATFVAGILFPVYTDEVGWRFQERAALDGVDKMFSEVCGMNTLAVPPFFMWPVRYFSGYLNLLFADPFYIRISGMLYAAAWLALLLVLLRRITSGERPRLAVTLIGVGLMSLATLPFLLIMSRPEQPMNLVALGVLLVSCAGWRLGNDAPASAGTDMPALAWRRVLVIVALSIVAMSYHLKSLFLLPLILACLFFCARGKGTLVPRATGMAGTAVLFAISTKYWVERVECLGDERLRQLYALQNVGATVGELKSLSDHVELAGNMIANITLMPYMMLIVPRVEPMSQWLEWYRLTSEQSRLWYLAIFAAFAIAILGGAIAFFHAARSAWRERRLDPRLVCAVMLMGSILAWSSTQVSRNAYEAAFVLPLLMLSLVLSIAAFWRDGQRPVLLTEILAVTLGVSALVSLALTWAIYGPSFAGAARERGYLSTQKHSISHFGYAAMEPKILKTAKMCHMPSPEKARAVMIDDYTYFAYVKSYLPQHQLGVLDGWSGSVKDDPLAYLKSRKSDGLIVHCKILPEDVRKRAKVNGQFCCLAPPEW